MAVEVNPYAAPASVVEQVSGEFGEPTVLSFRARAGRLRYLTRSMIATIVAYVILTVALMVVTLTVAVGGVNANPEDIEALVGPALIVPMLVIGAVMLVVSWMLGMQRLHDLNLTGWLHLLMLVPLVNLIFALYLLFAPGTKGPNRFGPPPPPNGVGLKVTAAILLVIWVLGFVAIVAVSIQAYGDYSAAAAQLQQQ